MDGVAGPTGPSPRGLHRGVVHVVVPCAERDHRLHDRSEWLRKDVRKPLGENMAASSGSSGGGRDGRKTRHAWLRAGCG